MNTELAEFVPPLVPVFKGRTDSYLEQVETYKCESAIDFERGKEYRLIGKALETEIVNHYKPIKQGIDASKQKVLDMERLDLAGVKEGLILIDNAAVPWKREQDRLAQEAADNRREEERKRKEAEKAKEVELLKEWGDAEGAKEVAQKPIPPSRPVTASSGFAYARGVRTKPKLKARVVTPDAVKRELCSPDQQKIGFRIANYLVYAKNPTEEQIKKWQEEIGGVELFWE